jgi:type IV secretory pathway VirJ component
MKITKFLFVFLLLTVSAISIWWTSPIKPPIIQKIIHTENFGNVAVAEPIWGSKGLALVFVDSKTFSTGDLAKRVAATGITGAIVDVWKVFDEFSIENGECLDHKFVATSIDALKKKISNPSENRLIVAGIAEGALIPFINAQSISGNTATNLSIGFTVNLPTDLALCPPLSFKNQGQNISLITSSGIKSNWRSVWTDHPDNETAIFIRALGKVDTRISAYDTPLQTLLVDELNSTLGKTSQFTPPMPVVEVPVAKPNTNVTLFYSGDGGWRDLDRTVAGEMAALNYPVVGIDVLRYFWEPKTPEQAATDLSATMAYYRKNWNTKSFVLTGYSFGADILPAIYNRLPAQDKNSVALLVLMALAKTADFEIHVSGWLGQGSGELPLSPELAQIPTAKILCIYGIEEKDSTACRDLLNSEAKILELPGGHHFDQNYPKLTRQILDVYRQHGIK